MKLCLVSATSEDGENLDLLVVARNKVEAEKIWNDYCKDNGWSRGPDEDSEKDYEPSHIRQILEDITDTEYDRGDNIPRAVEWEDVRLLA